MGLFDDIFQDLGRTADILSGVETDIDWSNFMGRLGEETEAETAAAFDAGYQRMLELSAGGGYGGGRGPRFGQAGYDYTPVEIGELKDRFHNMVLGLTGFTPEQLGTSFEWYRPKWESGWSQSDFERYYRGTQGFKDAYPSIPEQLGVDDYMGVVRRLNAVALKKRNAPVTRQDIEQFFGGGTVNF